MSAAAKHYLITQVTRGAAFSPSDISGLALWLNASTSTDKYQDDGTSTPADENNDPVRRWYSQQVGTTQYARAPSDAERAPLLTGIQNGRSVLRFDGTAHYYEIFPASTLLRNVGYGYIFAAYNPRQTAATTRYVYKFTGAADRVVMRESSQRVRLASIRLDADSPVTITSDTDHGGVACVITAVLSWAGGTFSLRQNGVQVASGSYASSGNCSDTALTFGTSRIGATGSLAKSMGDHMEYLVYQGASPLSAGEISQVESYLASKWGITLNP